MTSHAVAAALEEAKTALRRFVEAEMRRIHTDNWERVARTSTTRLPVGQDLDLSALLAVIINNWQSVFQKKLSQMDRALVSELRETRNRWAHQKPFSTEDALRALDTTSRLLRSIGAIGEADRVESLRRTVATARPNTGVLHKPLTSAEGEKRRWSPPSPRQSVPARNDVSKSRDPTLDDIVRCLNDQQIRATYGAVAEIVGGIAQSIGRRLGPRRVEASWIVNASSGLPTGYQPNEMHQALQRRAEIITTGDELRRRLKQWRAGR